MDKLREALVKWRNEAPGFKSWRELLDAYKESVGNNKVGWLAVIELLAYEEALQQVDNVPRSTCEGSEKAVSAFSRAHTHAAVSLLTETQKRLGLRSLRHISVQPWDSDID